MSRSRRNAKADEYFRRAPNYSAKAIEDMLALLPWLAPQDKAITRWLINGIQDAHKFSLPDHGEIMGPRFSRSMLTLPDCAQMPFANTALEYDAPPRRDLPPDRLPCRERIIACLDARDIPTSDGKSLPRGFVAWPVVKPTTFFQPLPFGFAFPYDGSVRASCAFSVVSGEAGRRHMQTLLDEGTDFNTFVISEYQTELKSVYQFLAALSCSNVTTELIRPNREARAARPESTLFDYHVLMIRPGAERHGGPPLGGSHASPRTHLRRGHIRQHPTAGRIWVNSCVVNPTAIGTVNKDYQLQGGIQ
jgi:hypothetical protein